MWAYAGTKINFQRRIEELVAHADIHAISGELGASSETQKTLLTSEEILYLPVIAGLKGLN